MKGLILWTATIAFVWLAMVAVDMGEYTVALVMGVVAVLLCWAAPGGESKKKSSKGAESSHWW